LLTRVGDPVSDLQPPRKVSVLGFADLVRLQVSHEMQMDTTREEEEMELEKECENATLEKERGASLGERFRGNQKKFARKVF